MISSGVQKAENLIIHLKTYLENTAKDIQQSKQTILSLKQCCQSNYSHHSISVNKNDLQSLHLNINMQSPTNKIRINDAQLPTIQYVTINGEKYIKYNDLGQYQQKQKQQNYIYIQEDCENKSQNSQQSVINRFSFGQQKQSNQESKKNNTFKDSIFLQNKSKEDSIVDQLVQELQSDKNQKNTKNKNRIFKNKYCNKSVNKQQKFFNIRKRLNTIETGFDASKDNKNPEESKYYFKLPLHKQNKLKTQIFQHKQTLSRTKHKEQSFLNLASNSKYNSRQQRKYYIDNRPKHLVSYFQKTISFTDNTIPIRTDKFMRKIQTQKRQSYIQEALKIPGIDRYFNYEQIYNIYLEFKQTGQSHYAWQQFLKNKLRKVGKLLIHQQRFTK